MRKDGPDQKGNRIEKLELKDQLKQSLEEARIVMPGVQALFGFQLIAVYNQKFSDLLDTGEQRLHLWAIALTAISMALAMAPAALHRQAESDSVSSRLVSCATLLLTAAMIPLMLALIFDFYLLGRVILKDSGDAFGFAGGLLALFIFLWFVMPQILRRWLNTPTAEAT